METTPSSVMPLPETPPGQQSPAVSPQADGGAEALTVQQALRRAVESHQRGDLAVSERLCRAILTANGANIDALNLLAILAARTGHVREAADLLRRAIAADPASAPSHNNLGNVLQALGQPSDAAAAYLKALELDPRYAEAHNNLGNAFRTLGRLRDAVASFDRALDLRPDYAEAWSNRGLALQSLGRPAEALSAYDRALAMAPEIADTHFNRGNVLRNLGRPAEALVAYERATRLEPGRAESWNNRGVVLQDLGRIADAIASFRQALSLRAGYADALSNCGNALRAAGRLDEALASLDRAVAVDGSHAEAWNNRGLVLRDMRRLPEALASCDRALALRPDFAAAWCNRGIALQELQRFDEALASYESALRLQPELAEARWNRGLCQLLTGDLAAGWEGYEWRWKNARLGIRPRDFAQPAWDGSDALGRLLVWGEQGMGDEIFYGGMLGELESRAGATIVEVDRRLVGLFARSYPWLQVVARPVPATMPFDRHIPMGGLGRIFRKDIASARRAARPYLRACPERTQSLRARIAGNGGLVCGLSWVSRNPAFGAQKSLALRDLVPLLRTEGTTFVNLQYGDTAKEEDDLRQAEGLSLCRIDDVDCLADIDGLAALVSACDIVVTVSNTTAHLAAALGKPVFVMLPYSPGLLWYWHARDATSPWYPSARLFRQPQIGDWTSVIGAVRGALAAQKIPGAPA